MRTRCARFGVLMAVVACWGSACGGNGSGGNAACTPGQSAPCACTDGTSGAQVCSANGTFGQCTCSPADAGADGPLDAEQDSPEADAASDADAAPDAPEDASPGDAADASDASGAGCAKLPANCGASASESCCSSPQVTGGAFNRSNDATYPATVSDFKLDKYEITVGRFRAFLGDGYGTQAGPPASGAGAHPKVAGSGWNSAWNSSLGATIGATTLMLKCTSPKGSPTWTDIPGANENYPINCISWFEAFAFCIWDGGRLATEAEWNYAAAGGAEQREYPWGATAPTSSLAVFNNAPLAAVGSTPGGDARWNHSDLAGSVWEWHLDLNTTYAVPCTDCANTTIGTERGLRGGSWYDVATLVTTYRHSQVPSFRDTGVGARCARDL